MLCHSPVHTQTHTHTASTLCTDLDTGQWHSWGQAKSCFTFLHKRLPYAQFHKYLLLPSCPSCMVHGVRIKQGALTWRTSLDSSLVVLRLLTYFIIRGHLETCRGRWGFLTQHSHTSHVCAVLYFCNGFNLFSCLACRAVVSFCLSCHLPLQWRGRKQPVPCGHSLFMSCCDTSLQIL